MTGTFSGIHDQVP
uniref:Uncharacterized protein n=1 Tax=Lepeophtheirus salmonis TaxID=72036 RepID=A0A0K2UMT9_LEPSM